MVHVAVIGAYGSAGVSAAETLLEAADRGRIDDLRLSLIDPGEPGGLCILRGCMPSKDVLTAGAHLDQVDHDDRLDGKLEVDPDAVVARKDANVAGFASHREAAIASMLERPNVAFHADPATFEGSHRLAVGGETLDVDHTIVATGSTPRIPSIPGIETVDSPTSDDLLDQTRFPERAVVIGFGAVGIELAPYLATVGNAEVVVLDRNDRPLSEADPAFGAALVELYRDRFDVQIETGADVTRVENTAAGEVAVSYDVGGDDRRTVGDQLYAFTGRRPNLDGLGLDRVGLEMRSGWIDASMRAVDAEGVYVVGDANGREPLLHVAKEEAITAARTITALERDETPPTYDPTIHRVVFAGLGRWPYARVGQTESAARDAGHAVVSATRAADDDGIFGLKGAPEGMARLVADAKTGRVLGYQGLHLHADVFAKTMQIVIENDLTVEALPDRAFHPTTPELLDGLIRSLADAMTDAS